ncbi:MAG: hypothetical protein IH988_07965 [Planctomycetes bacterium]|nr:hypothetical protein [Planctomycetota bacterium]
MTNHSTPNVIKPVSFPVDRRRAARRGVSFLSPGVGVVALFAWLISRLEFIPSGVSNRITEYALACIYLMVALGGLALVWRGLYWLCVALWPRPVCVVADADAIRFELGPMGRQCYDLTRVSVVYPFDEPEEGDDGVYEALRDPEKYAAEHLPRMTHPDAVSHLDVMIRHLVTADEVTLVRQLKPIIDRCQRPQSPC